MYFKIVLVDIKEKKGKLSKGEKKDIMMYIDSVRIEAENDKKAVREFANMVNGRLARETEGDSAVITLPDYGSCQLIVDVAETE